MFFILDHDVQNIKHFFLDLLQIKIALSSRKFYFKEYSIYIQVIIILVKVKERDKFKLKQLKHV